MIGADLTRHLGLAPGEGRTKGYHVYFTRGADGVWRIDQC
jgi:hypothetical protein